MTELRKIPGFACPCFRCYRTRLFTVILLGMLRGIECRVRFGERVVNDLRVDSFRKLSNLSLER